MTRWKHLRAVEALEAEATAVVLGALGSVLDSVAATFGAITAAAEDSGAFGAGEAAASLDDLTRIQPEWSVKVDGTIVPYYDRVFEAGVQGVTEQIADMRGVATDVVTAGDPFVLDQRKTQHLAAARDRFARIGDDAWAAARGQMLEGFAAGEPIGRLQERITDVVDVSKSQAEAMARTEVIAASNAGATANVDAMGADAPPFKQWVATNDKRTRPTHRAADGQVVAKGDQFQVGDASLGYPGDYGGPASEVINCRCTLLFTDTEAPFELPPDLLTEIEAEMASALGSSLTYAAAVLGPEQIDGRSGALHTGGMIALVPADPPALLIEGGEPVDNLHLTLAYLGDSADITPEQGAQLKADLHDWAASQPGPLPGEAFGAALWNPEAEPSLVYSIGGDGLEAAHDETLAVAEQAMKLPEQHEPWVAHVCAAYTDDEAMLAAMTDNLGPVTFDRVRLAVGGSDVVDYILGEPVTAAATPEETMADPTDTGDPELAAQPGEHFHSIMHTQGASTGRRTFLNLGWRTPPFAFHWQRSSSAHGGQPETLMVGQVTRVVPDPMDPQVLHGYGRLDLGSETGREYARLVVERFATGVSVGLDETPFKRTVTWPDGVDPMDPMALMEAEPEQVTIDGGRIGELTGTSVPAQWDATIEATPELMALMGAGTQAVAEPTEQTQFLKVPEATGQTADAAAVADRVQALAAAAYRIEVRESPPAGWYQKPTDVEITSALTITDKGRVYGMVAPLGVNHRAFAAAGRRQEVPFGNVDYSRFMGGWGLSDGGLIAAGPLTMDTGHAPRMRADHTVGPAHYDNSGSVIAAVSVGEDRDRGMVWMAGALVPGVGLDMLARALACRCSGDWQPHPERSGWMELVACLLVPSPAYPQAHAGPSATWDQDGVLVASSVPVVGPAAPVRRGPLAAAAQAIAASIGVDRRSIAAATAASLENT